MASDKAQAGTSLVEDAWQPDDGTSFASDVSSDGVHAPADGGRLGRLATTERVVTGLPHEITPRVSLGPSGGENPVDSAMPSAR